MKFGRRGIDERVIEFLRDVGTGVMSYRKKQIEIPEDVRRIDREIAQVLKKRGEGRAMMIGPGGPVVDGEAHELELGHATRSGEVEYFTLDLESAGTRRLLVLLTEAFRALDKGDLLVVDELEASLHTQACQAFVALFSSRRSNFNGPVHFELE